MENLMYLKFDDIGIPVGCLLINSAISVKIRKSFTKFVQTKSH